MQKLQKTVKAIEQREGIKLHGQRRAEEALELLASGTTPYAMGVRAEATCLDFVGNGSKLAGLSMAILCAVFWGKSAIRF